MSRENAAKVLREVQGARETFEQNILDVWRKHEQSDLFTYFERTPQFGEEENAMRIRKQVRDRIKEINSEIQTEIHAKKNPIKAAKENIPAKPWRLSIANQKTKQLSAKAPPNIVSNKKTIKSKSNIKKMKDLKDSEKSKLPPNSSTAYDDLVLQHIYGRQAHQSHRHTFKNENPAFCSPCRYDTSKVRSKNDETNNDTHYKAMQEIESSIQPRDNYCIHLQLKSCDDISCNVRHSIPTAIPLLEPSRCLSERVPLKTLQGNVCEGKLEVTKRLSRAGPNVAVINIKADDMNNNSLIKSRIKSRVHGRLKKKIELKIQSLPNVDIDTITDPSSVTSSNLSQSDGNNSDITYKSEPKISHLKNENDDISYGFQDFISVQDVNDGELSKTTDVTMSEESFHQGQISLSGYEAPEKQANDGPVFPPQHYPEIDCNNVNSSPTLEQHIQDFLEQELLAQLLSKIKSQENDPPLQEFSDNLSLSSIQEIEKSSFNWFDHIIGLEGIQLFVNAGIPVDKDLIAELIKSVIIEMLDTLFGYPKSNVSDIIKPVSHVESVENAVPTPVKTPARSPCVSENNDIKTPDQTISDVTDENIDDIVNEAVSSQKGDNLSGTYEAIKTPELSISESCQMEELLHHDIKTPDASMIEEKLPETLVDVVTPTSSKSLEVEQIKINDFQFTDPVESSVSAIVKESKSSKQEFENTPSPIFISRFVPVPASPSTPSTTFTMSSSTAVGLSTYDGISVGEYLNKDYTISGVSEGELGLPGGMEVLKFIKNSEQNFNGTSINELVKNHLSRNLFTSKQCQTNERVTNANGDILSEGELIETNWKPLKSIGEVSNISDIVFNKTDEFGYRDDDGTLQEISFSKISNEQHDEPFMKPADKIPLSEDPFYSQHMSHKSEGEFRFHDSSDLKCIASLSSVVDNSMESFRLGKPKKVYDVFEPGDRNFINVKPVDYSDGDSEAQEVAKSEGEIFNVDSLPEVSKSEGELMFKEELELESDQKIEGEKVVMVLRLPNVEEDQVSTDDLTSHEDISDISVGEF